MAIYMAIGRTSAASTPFCLNCPLHQHVVLFSTAHYTNMCHMSPFPNFGAAETSDSERATGLLAEVGCTGALLTLPKPSLPLRALEPRGIAATLCVD